MIIQLCLAVGLAILLSGLCSLCEAVLLSVSPARVEMLFQSKHLSGKILKNLKKDINKPIIAILTLNTIANTMGAAVAGASAAVVFGDHYLGWFSASLTLAILLVAEILPKTIGVAYCRALAPWIALPVSWLVLVLTPFIKLCQAVTRLILGRSKEFMVSAEEIITIVAMSREAGKIDQQEEKVIANILDLKNKYVRQVMTPRTVTFTLSQHLTVEEVKSLANKWESHSRVPVYDKDQDDIVGIVLRKDVLLSMADNKQNIRLERLKQPVHFVPEAAPLTVVLRDFFEKRRHLFVVVDEYGGFTGVISLEDIIEEIMGREIMDESDKAKDMRILARDMRKAEIISAPAEKDEIQPKR